MSCRIVVAWTGRIKTKDIFHVFVSVTWLLALIYYMLAQLLESDHPSSNYSHVTNEVLVSGLKHTEISHLMLGLGFTVKPRLTPDGYINDNSLPVFVLLVEKHQIEVLYGFLGNFKLHFPGKRLIIYNLGLPEDEVNVIKGTCQCQVRQVDWNKYPAHVNNKRHFHAYRPLLIQETLLEFGVVFWCNVMMRFISSDLTPYLAQANRSGIVSWWHQQYPTSALTHHNMFRYFNTNNTNFYFQRVAQPDMALLMNTEAVHKKLMLPWIYCCLNVECIAPRGSQPGGCNFMHKPKYIYAGCHHYDISAYNIVLGQMFNMETPYFGSYRLFTTINNT